MHVKWINSLAMLAIAFCIRIVHVISDLGETIPIAAERIYRNVTCLIMKPFHLDNGLFGGWLHQFKVTAQRIINQLKPEYDASYDTAGQSLAGMDRWH